MLSCHEPKLEKCGQDQPQRNSNHWPLQWTSPLTRNPTYGVTAWNLPASVVGHLLVQGGSNDGPAP